jgi:hypothetical protein
MVCCGERNGLRRARNVHGSSARRERDGLVKESVGDAAEGGGGGGELWRRGKLYVQARVAKIECERLDRPNQEGSS